MLTQLFQVQPSTKTNDILQTSCYDWQNNYVYFEATQNQGSSDDVADPTVIVQVTDST